MTVDEMRARWPTLTAAQAAAVLLYERGLSEREVARLLGISREAARDRLRGAERRILAAEAAERAQEASPA